MAQETLLHNEGEFEIYLWKNPKPVSLLIKATGSDAEIELCLGVDVDVFCDLLKKLSAEALGDSKN